MRDSRRPAYAWGEADERAETNPLAPPMAGELRSFLPWLERVALLLGKAKAMGDLVTCEQLIAEIAHHDCDPRGELGPMDLPIRQCVNGTRAIVRAIAAGSVELSPALREDLIELVRDIAEIVMTADLARSR